MFTYRSILALAAAAVLISAPRVHADWIQDWFVSVHVSDGTTGADEIGFFLYTPSPFQDSHAVAVGASTSSASYDFAWSGMGGDFHVDGSQAAFDVSSDDLFSVASGSIWVRPNVDMEFSTLGMYSFFLPPDAMFARFSVDVLRTNPTESVFSASRFTNSFAGFPVSGTFNISGGVLLTGGETYVVRYQMFLQSFAGGTGSLATGSGSVDFHFQAVPEPATLAVIAIGFVAARNSTRVRKNPHCR